MGCTYGSVFALGHPSDHSHLGFITLHNKSLGLLRRSLAFNLNPWYTRPTAFGFAISGGPTAAFGFAISGGPIGFAISGGPIGGLRRWTYKYTRGWI